MKVQLNRKSSLLSISALSLLFSGAVIAKLDLVPKSVEKHVLTKTAKPNASKDSALKIYSDQGKKLESQIKIVNESFSKINEFNGMVNALSDKSDVSRLLTVVARLNTYAPAFDSIQEFSLEKGSVNTTYADFSGDLRKAAEKEVKDLPDNSEAEKKAQTKAMAELAELVKIDALYKTTVGNAKKQIAALAEHTKTLATLVSPASEVPELKELLPVIAGANAEEKLKVVDAYRAKVTNVVVALGDLATLINSISDKTKLEGVAGSWHETTIDAGQVVTTGKDTITKFFTATDQKATVPEALAQLIELDKVLATALISSVEKQYTGGEAVDPAQTTIDGKRTQDIRVLHTAIQNLLSSDPENDLIDKEDSDKLTESESAYNRVLIGRATFLGMIDPTIGEDATNWVSDYIRLFYFTDVKRLLKTLNPNTRVANPEATEFQDSADKATKRLNDSEDQRTILVAKLNQLAEEQAGLEDQLSGLQRKANAATRIQERATNEKERVDTINSKDDDRITELATSIKDDEASLVTVKATIAKYETTPPTNAEERKDLAIQRREKVRLESKIAREKLAKERVEAQKKARKNQTTITDQAKADADKASAKANDALTLAEDQTSGIAAKIAALKGQLSGIREQIIANRVTNRRLANDEVTKFGLSRDNAEFYVSPPGSNENDPTRRVVIYGYKDSNTLLIRGNPEDVDHVKEIIAAFDRPAPQARISLYTIQISGQVSPRNGFFSGGGTKDPINNAVKSVNDELRNLQTVISIVQDSLRKSITNEVGRCNRIANETTGDELPGRLGSYCFYSQTVRSRLGFDWTSKRNSGQPSFSNAFKLRSALEDYQNAKTSVFGAIDQGKDTAKFQLLLRQANYSFDRIRKITDDRPLTGNEPLDRNISELLGNLGTIRAILATDSASIDESKFSHAVSEAYAKYIIGHPGKRKATPLTCKEQLSELFSGVDEQLALLSRLPSGNQLVTIHASDKKTLEDQEYLTHWTLPDPSQGTTLGQMMFVLSLASKDSRDRVLNSFAIDVYKELSLAQKGKNANELSKTFKEAIERFKEAYSDKKSLYPQFLNVIDNGLSSNSTKDNGEYEMTSNQLEVLQAIEIKARETVASEIRSTIREIAECKDSANIGLEQELRNRYEPLLFWLSQRINVDTGKIGENGNQKLLEMFSSTSNSGDKNDAGMKQDSVAWQIAEAAGQRNSLARARPRVAAADEMLKRLIISAETDLDYFFVQPALTAIRQNVMKQGVQLGVIEHQSILATNRMVARLSTDANSSTTLEQGTDFRDQASQLFSMADQYRANSIKSGLSTGSLGLAGALAAKGNSISPWSAAGIAGVVDILSSQDEEKRGDVYSINNNGVFKVTPIFDPSGQALRFKFDHVAQTYVQGPDGTSSRDLPRVERTSVNTEVQLSNLEFREIARYGTNSKVGTADTRRGGVPIIKDLPIIRDIPLLGYYSRRYASAATRQESLIFAQTSVYPTVSDIVDLLLDVTPVNDLNPEPPSYLKLPKKQRGGKK